MDLVMVYTSKQKEIICNIEASVKNMSFIRPYSLHFYLLNTKNYVGTDQLFTNVHGFLFLIFFPQNFFPLGIESFLSDQFVIEVTLSSRSD